MMHLFPTARSNLRVPLIGLILCTVVGTHTASAWVGYGGPGGTRVYRHTHW